MKKYIELPARSLSMRRGIEYTLKISDRARKLRLAVYCNGNVVVTAPRFTGHHIIHDFIKAKSHWIIDKLEYFKVFGKKVSLKNSREDFLKHKDDALKLAHERLAFFNTFYGHTYQKVTIRNQETRWGSCSRKGNLSFNYKIAILPPHIADYVIVHELCHLREFNHSRNFWDLVKKQIPNHKEVRRELKKIPVSFY